MKMLNTKPEISVRPDGDVNVWRKFEHEGETVWQVVRVLALPSVAFMLELTEFAKENGGW